jgi:uncharacterized protein YdaU (DUF1376 family)
MTETGAWMPMYWGDYLGDTMHLSTIEHGAYLLLIATYWRRGKPLPDDDLWLANVTKLSPKKWKMVRPKIADLFHVTGGSWEHRRVEKEILRSSGRLKSARAAGTAGGIATGVAKSKLTTTTTTSTVKKERIPPKNPPPSDFESWWSEYPRKVGKKAAAEKYAAAVKNGTTPEKLIGSLRAYIAYLDSEGTETQFMVHPATWLQQGRWDDDLTVRRKATTSEQLEAWARDDGDQRRNQAIDRSHGRSLEVPERGPKDHGHGLPCGTVGSERRTGARGGACAVVELEQVDPAEARRREDNRKRIEARLAETAKALRPGAKP